MILSDNAINTVYAVNGAPVVSQQNKPTGFLGRLKSAVSLVSSRIFGSISQTLLAHTPTELLFCAIREDDSSKAKAALKTNANIHAVNKEGNSLLQIALYGYDYPRDDIACLLVKNGADIKTAGDSLSVLLFAVRNGAWKFAEVLLEKGANINARNTDGRTQLHQAAKAGDLKMVKGLLGLGADAALTDCNGMTALHHASLKGFNLVVAALLRAEKNPDAKDDQQRTPLHLAASKGHSLIVEHLLKAGASPNVENAKKEYPLTLALMSNQEKRTIVAHMLLGAGSEIAPLIASRDSLEVLVAIKNERQLIQRLFKKGLNDSVRDKAGRTLVHRAVIKHPGTGFVRVLLECGFQAALTDFSQDTPLHNVKSLEDAIALIEYNARLEAKNKQDETPIFEAVRQGNLPIFTLLLAKGADPYHINSKQKNIVHVAKKRELQHTALSKEVKKAIHLKPELMKSISGTLQHIINAARTAAHVQKKQLLIILGETHGEYRGFIVEKLALKVANGLGIKKVLVETSFTYTFLTKNQQRDVYLPIACAKKLGMEVIGVDNNRTDVVDVDVSLSGMHNRNAGIKAFTEKVFGDKLLITGSAHMQGLMSVPETQINRATHYIVPIRLTYQDDYYLAPGQFIQLEKDGFNRESARAILKKWNGK